MINQIPTEQVEKATTEQELLTIENSYWVELWNSLERLKSNEDFKKVILEGYLKDKAIKGVSLLATDFVKKNSLRADVMEQLVAISNLEDYFITVENLGTVPEVDEDEE